MEMKWIEAFVAVAEKDSFNVAAESLFISQPTISLRIQKLEHQLNTVLFERKGGKRAVLTPAGKQIYPYYKEVLNLITKGNEVLQTDRQGFGKIRLSCPNHMGHTILPGVLKSLFSRFGNIDFDIKVRMTSEILKDIQEGETEVGLVHLDKEEVNEHYTIMPIAMEKIVLVASPDHPLVSRCPIQVLDLQAEKFFTFAKTSNANIIVDLFLKRNGLTEYNTIEIMNLEWIKTMVKSGLGISFLQNNTVEDELKSRALCELSFTKPLPTTPISIIYRNDVPKEIIQDIFRTMKQLYGS